MRRLSALALAAALGGTALLSAPANAVGFTTCVASGEVSVLGPNGAVYVEYLTIHNVGDCI